MFHDEFYYRPRFKPFLGYSPCMKFEGDGDPDDGGGGGGGEYEHWTDRYPSTKGNATMRRYATEEEAHGGHIEARTMISDPLRLPKSLGKMTNEQKADWEAQVGTLRGVPAKAEDYELKSKDFPKDVKIDEEFVKAAKEMAKTLHIPQVNLQAFYNLQLNMIAKQVETHAKANEESGKTCIAELEELWGKEQSKENFVLIERALRGAVNPDWQKVKAEDDEAWQDFKKKVYVTGVGNNKVLMQLLKVAADSLEGSGKLITGVHGDSKLKEEDMTEEQIQQAHFPASKGMLS